MEGTPFSRGKCVPVRTSPNTNVKQQFYPKKYLQRFISLVYLLTCRGPVHLANSNFQKTISISHTLHLAVEVGRSISQVETRFISQNWTFKKTVSISHPLHLAVEMAGSSPDLPWSGSSRKFELTKKPFPSRTLHLAIELGRFISQPVLLEVNLCVHLASLPGSSRKISAVH